MSRTRVTPDTAPSPTHAEITFALGSDRNGKAQITMMYKNGAEVAMLLD